MSVEVPMWRSAREVELRGAGRRGGQRHEHHDGAAEHPRAHPGQAREAELQGPEGHAGRQVTATPRATRDRLSRVIFRTGCQSSDADGANIAYQGAFLGFLDKCL